MTTKAKRGRPLAPPDFRMVYRDGKRSDGHSPRGIAAVLYPENKEAKSFIRARSWFGKKQADGGYPIRQALTNSTIESIERCGLKVLAVWPK